MIDVTSREDHDDAAHALALTIADIAQVYPEAWGAFLKGIDYDAPGVESRIRNYNDATRAYLGSTAHERAELLRAEITARAKAAYLGRRNRAAALK